MRPKPDLPPILKTTRILAVAFVALALTGMASHAGPLQALCESTPEEQGMDSSILSQGLQEIVGDSRGLDSLLVVRNGCLVLETYRAPYARDRKHYLNSATKSVLSALVGIAIHEGKLRENDAALSYLPDYPPADRDPRKMKITVKYLLTMSSGISWPQTATGENASNDMGKSLDWVRFIVDRPMGAEPGSVTNYSNGDPHLLAAVLQKVTKTTALEFAQQHLFTQLGIEDVAWDKDPQGRSIGSAALQMRPIDMAKFGILYLQGGKFGGHRILDSNWVEASLRGHVKMPAMGGAVDYGYYWWLYPERNLFEAWGGAGQRIGVFRDLGLVIIITANMPQDIPRSPYAARIYDLVRSSVKSSNPLPANPTALKSMKRSLADLTGH